MALSDRRTAAVLFHCFCLFCFRAKTSIVIVAERLVRYSFVCVNFWFLEKIHFSMLFNVTNSQHELFLYSFVWCVTSRHSPIGMTVMSGESGRCDKSLVSFWYSVASRPISVGEKLKLRDKNYILARLYEALTCWLSHMRDCSNFPFLSYHFGFVQLDWFWLGQMPIWWNVLLHSRRKYRDVGGSKCAITRVTIFNWTARTWKMVCTLLGRVRRGNHWRESINRIVIFIYFIAVSFSANIDRSMKNCPEYVSLFANAAAFKVAANLSPNLVQ